LVGNSDRSVGRRAGWARGGGGTAARLRARRAVGAFVGAGLGVATTAVRVGPTVGSGFRVFEGEGAGGGDAFGAGDFPSPSTSSQSTGAAATGGGNPVESSAASKVAGQIGEILIRQTAGD
jgi:hypothetical protein